MKNPFIFKEWYTFDVPNSVLFKDVLPVRLYLVLPVHCRFLIKDRYLKQSCFDIFVYIKVFVYSWVNLYKCTGIYSYMR